MSAQYKQVAIQGIEKEIHDRENLKQKDPKGPNVLSLSDQIIGLQKALIIIIES